ncbi:hypothetical protein ACJX0J_025443, partial [Zea mays]
AAFFLFIFTLENRFLEEGRDSKHEGKLEWRLQRGQPNQWVTCKVDGFFNQL